LRSKILNITPLGEKIPGTSSEMRRSDPRKAYKTFLTKQKSELKQKHKEYFEMKDTKNKIESLINLPLG